MRITIDIDETELVRIQEITREKKKSPAIHRALTELIRLHDKRQCIERALQGGTGFALSNEEVEAADVYEDR